MFDNPRQFLKSLPKAAGIYQMYDDKCQLLYVGKAKNLKQRVSSYFRPLFISKTKLFMEQVAHIEIVLTPNENAALLLESNLIKTRKPRYNVLFKDDKSFPYILLSEHMFPRVSIYRGALNKVRGKYFGPFPDVGAVKLMLDLVQRIFRLRVCQDSCMPCIKDPRNPSSIEASKKSDFERPKFISGVDERYKVNEEDYTLRIMNSGAKPSCEHPELAVGVNEEREQLRRQSMNSFYAGYVYRRSRPCILYPIKRCSAPCVGHIDQQSYTTQIELTRQFLLGKDDEVVQQLTKLMEDAAARLAYEQAMAYRDQIASIHKIQTTQSITKDKGNYDIIAVLLSKTHACVNMLCVRRGLLLGNRNFITPLNTTFPASNEDTLRAFILHYYWQEVGLMPPEKILLKTKLLDTQQITYALEQKFVCKIILAQVRSTKHKQLIAMAEANAMHALKVRQHEDNNYSQGLRDLVEKLGLENMPRRIECFDVSHNVGEAQVVSCVVFDAQGSVYREFRRFNVHTISQGDDYHALRIALERRYRTSRHIPDIILIDGGKGQLHVTYEVCHKLHLCGVFLLAIAKGAHRKVGLEQIYILGKNKPLFLGSNSAALQVLQMIRDTAHNFALTGHRKQMTRARLRSGLDQIAGIGTNKRKALLQYFGGIGELRAAGISDLEKVKGIGKILARNIYNDLHGCRQ